MKNWTKSLTIWFNAIAAVLFEAEQMLGVFKGILGDSNFYRAYALTVLVANILIRVFLTKTSIRKTLEVSNAKPTNRP